MSVVLITGSGGLIGSEAVAFFASKGFDVLGIDNDMRSYYFGKEASTRWNVDRMQSMVPNYRHLDIDIRDHTRLETIFGEYGRDITAVVHCAAQPSHDWASRDV